MKQFLVPALLLSTVLTVAAVAAGSAQAPVVEGHGSARCATESMESGGRFHLGNSRQHGAGQSCTGTSGAAAAADRVKDEDCVQKCEDQQELDCCKKKLECPRCKDEPAQKP
jgi:hypothetical protein